MDTNYLLSTLSTSSLSRLQPSSYSNSQSTVSSQTFQQLFSSMLMDATDIMLNPYVNRSTLQTTASASVPSAAVSQTSTTSNSSTNDLDSIIANAAATYNVNEQLIRAVIQTESNYDTNAESAAGAQGLMQLMPATAAGLGVTDSFDPEQNVMAGTKYLSQMLSRYNGNTSLALAAYNAGPGNVDKYDGIPPFEETTNYVQKIMGSYLA